ncbi:hypothetical protein GJ744_007906 [Endocarpon pusillum]|uniref:Uncharacterized protein n=1 Tax=Endocarpon pusillum TaxID=364733 RepID=A0A8H7ALZ6_9EURO|nr:hypothetical protein GJ744_007906 [Endocarpon pusillum]
MRKAFDSSFSGRNEFSKPRIERRLHTDLGATVASRYRVFPFEIDVRNARLTTGRLLDCSIAWDILIRFYVQYNRSLPEEWLMLPL